MLNWEPVEHLSDLAPWYISDLLTDYNLIRLLRSAVCVCVLTYTDIQLVVVPFLIF